MATKNKASDTINKITPKFNPFWTELVWLPRKVYLLVIYHYINRTISHLMGFKNNA